MLREVHGPYSCANHYILNGQDGYLSSAQSGADRKGDTADGGGGCREPASKHNEGASGHGNTMVMRPISGHVSLPPV